MHKLKNSKHLAKRRNGMSFFQKLKDVQPNIDEMSINKQNL